MFWQKYGWPLGIIMALALFMGMTIGFVRKAFSERVDLVAVDYYYRDKAFSERLARQKKLLQRGSGRITRSDTGVRIHLPNFFTHKKISGTVYFYSPLNPAEDFSQKITFHGNEGNVAATATAVQRWRISFDFAAEGENYFLETLL